MDPFFIVIGILMLAVIAVSVFLEIKSYRDRGDMYEDWETKRKAIIKIMHRQDLAFVRNAIYMIEHNEVQGALDILKDAEQSMIWLVTTDK